MVGVRGEGDRCRGNGVGGGVVGLVEVEGMEVQEEEEAEEEEVVVVVREAGLEECGMRCRLSAVVVEEGAGAAMGAEDSSSSSSNTEIKGAAMGAEDSSSSSSNTEIKGAAEAAGDRTPGWHKEGEEEQEGEDLICQGEVAVLVVEAVEEEARTHEARLERLLVGAAVETEGSVQVHRTLDHAQHSIDRTGIKDHREILVGQTETGGVEMETDKPSMSFVNFNVQL